jgi:hypothetical protein
VGQFPRLEDEGSEESSPQVVGLTDGGGASEGMHPRLHVPRRRSAPKAAANADVSHPVEQDLVQSLGVFIDTLVICSATAFVILFDRFCTSRTREAREEAKAGGGAQRPMAAYVLPAGPRGSHAPVLAWPPIARPARRRMRG